MWWLLKTKAATAATTTTTTLNRRSSSAAAAAAASNSYSSFQLSTYPDSPVQWVKVDVNNNTDHISTQQYADESVPIRDGLSMSRQMQDKDKTKKKRKEGRFLLREIKKPNRTALRLPLQSLKQDQQQEEETRSYNSSNINDNYNHIHTKAKNDHQSFPVPASWRCPPTPILNVNGLPNPDKKQSTLTIKLPLARAPSSDQGLSLKEKLRILHEQEGYTPPKPRCNAAAPLHKSLDRERQPPSEAERRLCNWISLEIKPLIGRLEGSRRSTSSIGKKLNNKSRQLRLWHEDFSHSCGRSARAILLHNLVSLSRTKGLEEKRLTTSEKDTSSCCKPICRLTRVTLPCSIRASPRITPEQQQHEIEKGGHGSSRDKLADYNMLVESLRRQKDARLDKEEARILLCKGILHDNAQEYRKAIESYKEYLILCIKNGDKEGEATAYNFIGCSLQEEQDVKIAEEHGKSNNNSFEVPSAAAIHYEKAEEYHKLHADIANIDGKFIAYTNLGLLYANLGRWSEATLSHQTALRCATLNERPEHQGVAVGNLGFTLFRQKEWVTAKACMSKYIQICIALKDVHGQAHGHYILGSIASQRKRHEEAIIEYEASLKLSRIIKDRKMETLAKIMIGVAQGDNLLEQQEEES